MVALAVVQYTGLNTPWTVRVSHVPESPHESWGPWRLELEPYWPEVLNTPQDSKPNQPKLPGEESISCICGLPHPTAAAAGLKPRRPPPVVARRRGEEGEAGSWLLGGRIAGFLPARIDPAMDAAAGGAPPRPAAGIRVRVPLVSSVPLIFSLALEERRFLFWGRRSREFSSGVVFLAQRRQPLAAKCWI